MIGNLPINIATCSVFTPTVNMAASCRRSSVWSRSLKERDGYFDVPLQLLAQGQQLVLTVLELDRHVVEADSAVLEHLANRLDPGEGRLGQLEVAADALEEDALVLVGDDLEVDGEVRGALHKEAHEADEVSESAVVIAGDLVDVGEEALCPQLVRAALVARVRTAQYVPVTLVGLLLALELGLSAPDRLEQDHEESRDPRLGVAAHRLEAVQDRITAVGQGLSEVAHLGEEVHPETGESVRGLSGGSSQLGDLVELLRQLRVPVVGVSFREIVDEVILRFLGQGCFFPDVVGLIGDPLEVGLVSPLLRPTLTFIFTINSKES